MSAKPKKPAPFDSEEWRAYHRDSSAGRPFALDRHPDAAALTRLCLESLPPGVEIQWGKLAAFVQARLPDAPTRPHSYRNWAAARLGWRPARGK